ncbi:hypothetical protein ACKWRH_29780 [Bradyrhizobium sp. Pa8]|uniref:hypothetical protein n=1 Tax=Bradyrhizobium sp. Pa8 TaxID=3386552 RepID=UPI00403F969A
MKAILKIALALSVLAGSVSAQAQISNTATASGGPKVGAKVTKKSQLHDGCHSRYAQMIGKPCH